MVAGIFEMFVGEGAMAERAGLRYAERRAVTNAAERGFSKYGRARVERSGFERIARYGERGAMSLLESAKTEYVGAELRLAQEANAISRTSSSLKSFARRIDEDRSLMGIGAFIGDIAHLADTVLQNIKDINGNSGNGQSINTESKNEAAHEVSRTLKMLMDWG